MCNASILSFRTREYLGEIVSGAKAHSSGVRIVCLRVSNFRSLQNIEMNVDELTVLVGSNNSGKTSVLDAVQAAIGATRKILTKDDIFLDDGEVDVPKDRSAVIDVLLRPTGDDGEFIDNFPAGSFWTELWGGGISQTLPDFLDQVAIRTTLAWNEAYGDYRTTRNFLQEWKPFQEWLTAVEAGSVSASAIEPVAMHYIDAKRDLEEDLRLKGSFFRRLTDDLGLSDKDVKAIEAALTSLNQDMISKSDVLKHLRETLLKLQDVIVSGQTIVDIAPIPRRLRDLSRGIDVTLGNSGAQAFPLNRHGMGTRSLASLLVFRAFASWREEKARAAGDSIHTFLALEEPEAHLHPQAQRALFGQVRAIPGQRIVSTHSPYFAGQAKLESLRLLIKKGKMTTVSALDLSGVDADDRRKLEREVIASKGDLLFARAIILFEGETEEQALPILCQSRFGMSAHELGFNFVGVGGGNYYPFLWLAKSFDIPWYILSDGEALPLRNLESLLGRAGEPKAADCLNVFIVPGGNDYEKQLLDEGYGDAVEAAISHLYGVKELDDYIAKLNGTPLKKVGGTTILRSYTGKDGRENARLDFMRGHKTRLAAPIAQAIIGLAPERRTPKCLVNLFKKLASDFGLK
jgi:putative ATP-dependent endonuclease of the OLD family